MNSGKKHCIPALFLGCFFAQASDVGRQQHGLRPWHTLAVTRHHDTVIVILNEERVLNRYLTRSYVLVGSAALRIRMGQATSRRALLILQLHTLIY